jgi:outer membrane protein OmpA-like peptidoglycan-associated protein
VQGSPHLRRSFFAVLGCAVLGLPGCVHTVHPEPSAAVQEARQRLAARQAAPARRSVCDGQLDELRADVSFVYGKADLDSLGRGSLDEAKAWLGCHPGALVAVAIKAEQHYRNPTLENELNTARGQVVMGYLAAAGVPDGRIVRVTPADDVLTVPAARLWIVANGNGF